MISFFRKIRRFLVLENKPVRYLKYAIGEIILVVIGILIALQINNWNEAEKERKREKMYLESLVIDLKESQAELERVIEKTDQVAAASIQLLEYSIDTVPMPPPAVFDSLVLETFGYTVAMTNEGTINDISGSGDLKVIRNDTLRRMIASWDAGFKMIREREDLFKSAFQENNTGLREEMDLFTGFRLEGEFLNDQTRKLLITDLPHRNRFISVVISARPLNELYKKKIQSIDTMIALTQRELQEL